MGQAGKRISCTKGVLSGGRFGEADGWICLVLRSRRHDGVPVSSQFVCADTLYSFVSPMWF